MRRLASLSRERQSRSASFSRLRLSASFNAPLLLSADLRPEGYVQLQHIHERTVTVITLMWRP